MLDAVVALGVKNGENVAWSGTGFIYGLKLEGEGENRRYGLWIITNKHVVKEKGQMVVRFNSLEDEGSKDYDLTLVDGEGNPTWFGHDDPNVDVAAIYINAPILRQDKRKFTYFRSDEHTAGRAKLKEIGVTEGDRVFVLGFPMGIVPELRQYTFCRSGVFSRVRDFIEDASDEFILDAIVFPGNSGGPVILCPSALAIEGTKTIQRADLVGIVKSYIPYIDSAISPQTGRARVSFEENSGLTRAESADSIREVVEKGQEQMTNKLEQLQAKASEEDEPVEVDNE